MPLILSGNVASAIGGGYEVANSCRFNSADSATLSIDMGTSSSRRIWTFSTWVKLTKDTNAENRNFVGTGAVDDQNHIGIDGSGSVGNTKIALRHHDGSSSDIHIQSNANYNDQSAWYHIVYAVDTTQGTDTNRVKLYVNGTQVTSLATSTYPDQNYDWDFFQNGATTYIGRRGHSSAYLLDGYLAETVWIDGTQYAASDFGEFDSDSPTIWKPKDISGLTFGNAGFYLSYSDSADLGADSSGNSNDFTVNNLDATDQAIDTPTNNFAVMNPLDNFYAAATITEGNCKISSDRYGFNTSTFALTKGKWYAEFKIVSFTGASVGITSVPADATNDEFGGNGGTGPGFALYHEGGVYGNVGVLVASGGYDSFSNNDIIGCALDLTNNRLYFANNGTWQGSSDPTDGTNALSITAPASTRDGHYFFAIASQTGNTAVWEVNFGGCPAFTVSSGNADADGYGNFEYAPPSGYYALCTKNLAEYG